MSILQNRRVVRAVESISSHPGRFLDGLVVCGIGVVLLLILFRLGGYVPYGWSMLSPTRALCVVAVLHGLSRLIRRDAGGIHPAAFLPVPFLVFAIGMALLAGWSLEAELKLVVWMQAYLLYFLVLHSVRTRTLQFMLITAVILVLAVGLFGIFRQAYFEPHWFPHPERLRSDGYEGASGGYLAVPATFAGWVLLLFPFFLIGAAGRRLSGPIRIVLGFLAFASVFGLLAAGSGEALLIAAVLIFLTPLFTSPSWKQRFKAWGWTLGVAAVLALFLWAIGSPLVARAGAIVAGERSELDGRIAAVAGAMFQDRPAEGHGAGAFQLRWDNFAPEDLRVAPQYAHNDWLELLAETGLLGVATVLLPLAGFLVFGFRETAKLPFHQMTESERIRLARMQVEQPSRRGRRRRRRKEERPDGKIPRRRLFIPAMGLGLLAFSIYACFSFSAQLPLVLFTAAIVAGLFGRMVHPGDLFREASSTARWFGAGVPLFIGVGVLVLGNAAFSARGYATEGEEALVEALESPDRLFFEPELLERAEAGFRASLELRKRNQAALDGLALTLLHRIYLEEEASVVGDRALSVTSEAIALMPGHGLFQLYHAMALGLAGSPWNEVENHFETALSLAPGRAQAHVAYASYLLLNGGSKEKAQALVERALQLDPEYMPARNLRTRMSL